MTLTVEPDGYLRRGMIIFVNCSIRFAGPRDHVPALKLTLDNEPAFSQGQGRDQTPRGISNIQRLSLVNMFYDYYVSLCGIGKLK